MTELIVQVERLRKTFRVGGGRRAAGLLHAVHDVDFDIGREETLGLVGESGSGKSTVGRMLVGLTPATAGRIRLFGEDITGRDGRRALARVRRRVQFVFQDPHASLDPRMRVRDTIAEPIDVAGGWSRQDRADRVAQLLETVGLAAGHADRFPHEFSGGQRQRIGIARALALEPDFVVCDEPVSSLDVSMQAQIVNLLLDLQERLGLSYLFIAHDLAVVRSVSRRVAVMYAGEIVELADRRSIYAAPRHPYTRALLDAVPRPVVGRTRSAVIRGEVPSLLQRPPGCSLHSRCPIATARCREEAPALREIAPGHRAACHYAE